MFGGLLKVLSPIEDLGRLLTGGASKVERYEAYKDLGVEWIGEILLRPSAEIHEFEAGIGASFEGVLR